VGQARCVRRRWCWTGAAAGRHLRLFIAISQHDLERQAAKTPHLAEAMFQTAAAQELLDRRERLLCRLQERGAMTLEMQPETLASCVLKRGRRPPRPSVRSHVGGCLPSNRMNRPSPSAAKFRSMGEWGASSPVYTCRWFAAATRPYHRPESLMVRFWSRKST